MEIKFIVGNPINDAVNLVKKNKIGYAGMKTKKYLKESLIWHNFDVGLSNNLIDRKDEIISIIKNINKITQNILQINELFVFLIPTSNKFITEKMGGITGFSPYKNVIHIYINSKVINIKNHLEQTFIHEFNHAYFHYKRTWKTLLDSLIAEGLAELFYSEITNYKIRSPWIHVLNDKEIKINWNKIKNLLDRTDLHMEVFFGRDNRFKVWTGYTIGYFIVYKFREKYSNFTWDQIMEKTPREILILSKINFIV